MKQAGTPNFPELEADMIGAGAREDIRGECGAIRN